MQRIEFFIGKGGVGKSTTSSLRALQLAQNNADTLLVSMDPAHNLSDIFETDLSEKKQIVTKNLSVVEIDIQSHIKKYLSSAQNQLKNSYRYLSAVNLENHFDIIKHSPGIVEYGLLLAFAEIIKSHKNAAHMIFDMPPTALSLKFFNLPDLSLLWLNQLLNLRNEIIEKQEIISRVKLSKKEIETDKIKKNLLEQIRRYESYRARLHDETTHINVVTNTDAISIAESKRIIESLGKLEYSVRRIIINKVVAGIVEESVFENIPNVLVPRSVQPLVGLKNCLEYIQKNELEF